MKQLEIHGYKVQMWTVTCNDCGFESGLVEVTSPDGTRGWLLSGAGCYDRRGPKEALKWAEERIEAHIAE